MGMTRSWSVIAAAFAAFVLAGCGGGAAFGTDTTTTGGADSTSNTTSPTASSLTLLASSPQLNSDADSVASGVTLTVIAKDANNNVVPGVNVVFSTPDSAELIVSNPAATDSNGRVSATLTTGGDPQNRTITVTASASSLSQSVAIQVIGTTLSISGQASTQINTPTDYTITLTDASGGGIPGKTVAVSTNAKNALSASSLATDASGQVTVQLTATEANSYLTASVLGLTATKNISVSTDQFSITAPAASAEINIGNPGKTVTAKWLQGGSPVADGTRINFAATRGTLSASSATTTNGTASVNVTSAQAGFSTIVASSDALTKPSANRTVEFVAVTPDKITVQANPSTVATNDSSQITAIVRDVNNNLVKNVTVQFSLIDSTGGTLSSATSVTDSQGLAKISYNAGSQTSSSQGVSITGQVSNDPSIQDTANLTVAGRAARITFGTGAEIKSKDESTYQLPFTVLITDSAGNPVSDASFRLSLVSVSYLEGTFGATGPNPPCPNEDINNNDILDSNEDLNGNGQLEPGRVASVPSTVSIDPNDGTGQFLVTYPKDYGLFVNVKITGVATVSGSETTASREFLLPVAQSDVGNLPGVSPYGTDLDCTTAN